MLTLDEIVERLSDRNLKEVARRTGLHYRTVYKYAQGDATNPPLRTMQVLSDYLSNGKEEA